MTKKNGTQDNEEEVDTTNGIKELTPATLKNELQAMISAKKEASEKGGTVGKLTSQLCEKYGLMPQAVTGTRKMLEMQDDKRQAIMRQQIQLWNIMGWFDQIDAFDDLTELFTQVTASASKRQPQDNNVSRSLAAH